jgi:hypothetical protein
LREGKRGRRGEERRKEEEKGSGIERWNRGPKDNSAALFLTSSPSIPYLRIQQSTLPPCTPPTSRRCFFFFFLAGGCEISPKCATIYFFLNGIKYCVLIFPFLKEEYRQFSKTNKFDIFFLFFWGSSSDSDFKSLVLFYYYWISYLLETGFKKLVAI